MHIKRTRAEEEPAPPAVCDICGRPGVAQLGGAMMCLFHYDDRKEGKPDHVHAELLRRIAAHPEWQPRDDETSPDYQRRMFKTCKELMGRAVKRMQRPLT